MANHTIYFRYLLAATKYFKSRYLLNGNAINKIPEKIWRLTLSVWRIYQSNYNSFKLKVQAAEKANGRGNNVKGE